MKKKNIKGFTLVELLVVIAILAILATVTVVGYIAFTDKADRSVDEQTVEQLNTVLQASEVSDGKPVNPSDAMAILEENGFNIENYEAVYSKNTIYWDSSTNRILIYTEGEGVTFPEDAIEKYSEVVASNLPKYWYQIKDAYKTILLEESTEKKFNDALNNLHSGETLQLQNDITLENSQLTLSGDNASIELDLNGYNLNLSYNQSVMLNNNNNLILRNGNLNLSKNITGPSANIEVVSNSSITLENINLSSFGTAIFPKGDAAQVNVIDSIIDCNNSGAYGIGTNAAESGNYNVIINVEDSKIINSIGSGLLLNVPGKYYIKNTTIISDSVGAIVRGGNATFENCLIKEYNNTNGNVDWINSKGKTGWEFSVSQIYGTSAWVSGNGVQYAGLCIGDWSNSYSYDCSCTLINTTVEADDNYTEFPAVYISQDGPYKAIFNYDENCKFIDKKAEHKDYYINSNNSFEKGTIIVNGQTIEW